jgi:very-short-patch-repair endonuclease
MAAVLACGTGAALSHAAAAIHWGLVRPAGGTIDVSVPTQAGRRAPVGVRLHRRAALDSKSVTVHRAIPVTDVTRTIADLRGVLSPGLVRRAARQAALFHGVDDSALTLGTRSDLELDFLAFCRRRRLPAPEVNVRLASGLTVDFLWPASKLVVETDDHRYHRGSVSFEEDRLRDLRLRRRGYLVHRYTGAQLRRYPTEIARELGEILSRASRAS